MAMGSNPSRASPIAKERRPKPDVTRVPACGGHCNYTVNNWTRMAQLAFSFRAMYQPIIWKQWTHSVVFGVLHPFLPQGHWQAAFPHAHQFIPGIVTIGLLYIAHVFQAQRCTMPSPAHCSIGSVYYTEPIPRNRRGIV